MLVLTRKESEKIVLTITDVEALNNGDEIEVSVERIQGNRISIGIEAPRPVRIVRGELLDRGAGDRNRPSRPDPIPQ